MESKREAILSLHRAGKSSAVISKNLCVARSTVWKTIKRYKERGDFKDRERSGRPRSKRSASMSKPSGKKIAGIPGGH